jgi:hypothetical protein
MAQSGHPSVARQCPLLGVKRTLRFQGVMSAFDAVDGASSAVSKCYSACVENESNKGGEATANVGLKL